MAWGRITPVKNCCKRLASTASSAQIPGPKYYPFLGPINDMLTMGKPEKLHLTLDEHHRRYGPIVHIKLGGFDTVFISSADAIRSVYLHEGKYPKHIIPPAFTYFNNKHKLARGLLFMDDEEWLKHRQPLNTFLLRDFKWMNGLIETTCDDFVKKIKRTTNAEAHLLIDTLDTELYMWSFYTMINLFLGSSVADQSDSQFNNRVWKLVGTFSSVFESAAKLLHTAIPLPLADRLNLKIWRDFERATLETLEISNSLISTLNNEMKSADNGLLRKMKAANFSDDAIARIFSDLLIAAGDTTVTSFQWLLHHVAKDAKFQGRLRKSITESGPSENESELVRASLREVLRLYPVAAFVGRILDSEATIGNFTVPRGWMALMSMYTAGRDPENFSHPSEFAPDRWLRAGNETDYKVYKPHGTLPFALGGRSCIGKKVAAYQIHCLITKILNNFSLESCNEGELNLKSQMIGIPDKKILISFRNLMS